MGVVGNGKYRWEGYMGLVCSSLSVWVLWATENIDGGDIWELVCNGPRVWVLWATESIDGGTHGIDILLKGVLENYLLLV